MAGRDEKAVELFVSAAEGFLAIAAHFACQNAAQEGLLAARRCAASEAIDKAIANLLRILGISRLSTRGFSDREIPEVFSRGVEIAIQRQLEGPLPDLLYGYWICQGGNGHYRASLKTAKTLLDLSADPRSVAHVRGHMALGISHLYLGNLRVAFEALSVAAEMDGLECRSTLFKAHIDSRIGSRCQASKAACLLGNFVESEALLAEALRIAAQIESPQSLAYSRVVAATIFAITEDFSACMTYAREALGPSLDFGFIQEQTWGTILDAFAADQIRSNAGERERCRRSLDFYETSGCLVAATEMKAKLVACYSRAGEVERGLEAVESALALSIRTDDRLFEAELLRLKGELLARCERSDEALRCFRQALDVARQQNAIAFALKILVNLVELANSASCRDAAKSELAAALSSYHGITNPLLSRAREALGVVG
jgi:tetratricopeptide (TPR) repeat protein